VRDEFYPKGRRRGIVVRVQADFARSGRLLRYALTLVDSRAGPDNGRVLGYDNTHGHHHRHADGNVTSTEFTSYEDLVKRFEAEVREYLTQQPR
jgi:hypothetical protein